MRLRVALFIGLIVCGSALGAQTLEQYFAAHKKPARPPARWEGLIGEYVKDKQMRNIIEQRGTLHVIVEWPTSYPLEEVSENEFRFPSQGKYAGAKLVFKRDSSGRAIEVEIAGVVFKRRAIASENGDTFRIQPQRPVEELRRKALTAKPPKERGEFHKSDLVEVTSLDGTVKLDIRYASTNNFLSTPFYAQAKAFMQRPAAEALVRAHRKLREHGYGLLIHDGYRPWHVTRIFWDATPTRQRIFVADPSKGSRHNRGCAVDLTLYDFATGRPIQMTGGYDEMSDRSFPDYPGGTSLQRWHRDLLRCAMEEQGFTVYDTEWWHFDYKDWRKYGIQNVTFEALSTTGSSVVR